MLLCAVPAVVVEDEGAEPELRLRPLTAGPAFFLAVGLVLGLAGRRVVALGSPGGPPVGLLVGVPAVLVLTDGELLLVSGEGLGCLVGATALAGGFGVLRLPRAGVALVVAAVSGGLGLVGEAGLRGFVLADDDDDGAGALFLAILLWVALVVVLRAAAAAFGLPPGVDAATGVDLGAGLAPSAMTKSPLARTAAIELAGAGAAALAVALLLVVVLLVVLLVLLVVLLLVLVLPPPAVLLAPPAPEPGASAAETG